MNAIATLESAPDGGPGAFSKEFRSHTGSCRAGELDKFSHLLLVIVLSGVFSVLLFLPAPSNAQARTLRNTITFDNQSGEPALVKVVGPTGAQVEVPNGASRTVNVAAGNYYLLARYGSEPSRYSYTKGDPFKVEETVRQYSAIRITLHKVAGGNYPTHSASSAQFDKAAEVKGGGAQAREAAQDIPAEPFAIEDDRLFDSSVPGMCSTDTKMESKKGEYLVLAGGYVERINGKFRLWCNGAKHTWIGKNEDIEGAIAIIDSDKDDPLQFRVDRNKGYVYVKGTGVVTMPDGRSVKLPLVGHVQAASPDASVAGNMLPTPGDWAGTATSQGIVFTINFSVSKNKNEITQLKVIVECVDGESKVSANLTSAGKMLSDGTLKFMAGQGSSGTMKFLSPDHAEVSYNAPFNMKCADKWRPVDGKWMAQKRM